MCKPVYLSQGLNPINFYEHISISTNLKKHSWYQISLFSHFRFQCYLQIRGVCHNFQFPPLGVFSVLVNCIRNLKHPYFVSRNLVLHRILKQSGTLTMHDITVQATPGTSIRRQCSPILGQL